MKVTIEFDLENHVEAERYKCALKSWEMAGLIDSFLDYLSLTANLPKKAQPSIGHVYDMYRSKIMQQGLSDVIEPDLQYVLEEFAIEKEV